MTELPVEVKQWLSEYCVKTISGIKDELEMIDEEVEKMKKDPDRCKICDYERMVRCRNYVFQTITEALRAHGAVK